ncbi:MAG TPA: CBS domain-containing protein [Geobacterales bacterium]|nr:CBS domain-containing protein [Geobacterales bacterium]
MVSEGDQAPRILVEEIMNDKPVCVDKSINISTLADMMSKKNVEAVIIVENDEPIGIVTEKDLLTKVLAKKLNPEDTKAEDIMSSPVITISPTEDIITAMKKMLSYNVRRLIVTNGKKVIGLITVSDILRITPSLLEIMKEKLVVNTTLRETTMGYCDVCGQWSDYLVLVDGQYLCENCRE